MLDALISIAWGDRSNDINRLFTGLMLLIFFTQLLRHFRYRYRISSWEQRLYRIERDTKEHGKVTITERDISALPPSDPYTKLWEFLPPFTVMCGLLGTFIGLTLALGEIPFEGDAQQIQAGVRKALPSMGSAFWTSLSALFASMLIRLNNAWMDGHFRETVMVRLARSEREIIEGLERLAFDLGSGNAFLRPHGLQEALWHQHNLLHQNLERMGSQISDAIRKEPEAARAERRWDQLLELQRSQNAQLEALLESQHALIKVLSLSRAPQAHQAQGAIEGQGEVSQGRSTPSGGSR